MVYPVQLRKEGGGPTVNLYTLVCTFLSFPPIFVLIEIHFSLF